MTFRREADRPAFRRATVTHVRTDGKVDITLNDELHGVEASSAGRR